MYQATTNINSEKKKLTSSLEKADYADELVIAMGENAKRAVELVIANEEKAKRADELVIAKADKAEREAELIITNINLQNVQQN